MLGRTIVTIAMITSQRFTNGVVNSRFANMIYCTGIIRIATKCFFTVTSFFGMHIMSKGG